MRKILLLTTSILSILIIVGVAFSFFQHSTTSVNASSSTNNLDPTYSKDLGAPAITPHLSAATSSNGATFTVDDVRQYLSTHPLPRRFSLVGGSKLIITKIEFLPSLEVGRLVGESTGMPNSHILCYAELKGTATFPGPQGSAGTLHKIYEVFDGQTGNLLIIGGQ